MTKKKKPAKKQAVKAKGQAAKASPTKTSKPPSVAAKPAPPPKADTAAKDLEKKKDKAAKPAPASPQPVASPAPAQPAKVPRAAAANGRDATSVKAPSSDSKPAQADGKDGGQPGGGRTFVDSAAAPDAVAQAAQPLQTFAVEMQRMAKESIEQTSEVLERLREARSVEEVVSLQTTFMQQSFRRTTEFAGRISQLMTSSHASLFQQGQAAMRSLRSIASGM